MSFSTTDIEKGADLVIKAVGEDVQGFLKDPNPTLPRQSSTADNNRARESLRDLSRWQLENNILVMNQEDRTYAINPEAINNLDLAQIETGGAFYKKAVDQHLPVIADLHQAGKENYVFYFNENHREVSALLEAPMSRPTESSMDLVAKYALNFVESAHKNPQAAADLPGVTRMDIEGMTNALAEAGYLVPGENPDRTDALSLQTSRGSYEQKLAIFEQASLIAANTDEGIVQGMNGPAMHAVTLKSAVDTAEIEQLPVFGSGKVGEMSVDSDLKAEDLKQMTITMLLAAQIVRNSQMSTDITDHDTDEPMVVVGQNYTTIDAEGNTTARNDLLATFRAHVKSDVEAGIPDVLSHGARADTARFFYVPDLASSARETRDLASTLSGFYKAAIALANYQDDDGERIDGDSGARALGGPHAAAEAQEDSAGEATPDFDRPINLDDDEHESEDTGAAVGTNQKAEIATERFARTNAVDLDPVELRRPESVIEMMAQRLEEAANRGILQRIGQVTGRDKVHGENDAAMFSGNRAGSFGGYEEFMESGQTAAASEKDFARDVYSVGQVQRRGDDFEQRLTKQGAIKIDADRGLFKEEGYKPGSASTADKRVANFLRDAMTDDEGKPNYALRGMLRKMSDRPIIANTQEEAQAWKNQAQAFVERENAEHKLRLEAASAKAGVWSVDLSRNDLQRAMQVAQASGNVDTPFHVKITETGITMARSDTPMLTASLGANAPESITNGSTKRELGGMIAPAAMLGALESMDKKETKGRLVFNGEVPKGLTSEYADQRQRELEASKAAKPKGLEPHLPDQLG